jgi:xylulokinase
MYIGLDLGTSGLRAIIMDGGGAILAEAQSSYEASHPRSGWSEQDPDLWIAACEDCFTQLAQTNADQMRAVQGIGLSGHMHGAVMVDADGAALRPALLWNDTRASKQAGRMDCDPQFRAVSGNIVFPGFTAPKVQWVIENEPEVFAKCAKVMLPKDYLQAWLTGITVTDMSDASGTAWFDVGKRAWSPDLVAKSGLSMGHMPDLREGCDPVGLLRTDLGPRFGLPPNITVVAGGADNAVAACGAGCFAEGSGFVSLGTSGVVLAAKDSFKPDAASAVHTFCHAVPDRWYQMGVILAATDCMNWLSRTLGQSPAELSALVSESVGEPSDLMFAPYLSGERTPHNDAKVRGAFIGLDVGHGPADLTRAVMQGVGFALADNVQALASTGTQLDRALAIGGGTKSRAWVQMIATILNLPLDLPEKGDFGAALGAARLAQVGATGVDLAKVMTRPPVSETIDPDTSHVAAYGEAHAKYQSIYPLLKAIHA